MRDIIQRFPDNPIIIFPQTAYFEDSEYGQRELAKSVQIYDAHKKLTVFCRDKATYELFQNRFLHTESYFTPDTVLYLTPQPPKKKSDTILFCFRADSEKTSLGDQVHNTAKALIQARGLHMEETSTVLNHDVSAKQRQQFLQEKWTQFASARLIITDRLHGMIFSAICGTPCIALDNVSKKVSGGAYWLKHLPYISVIDSAEQCECAIREKLENQSESLYNRDPLNAYYDEMKNVVLHYVRK